ncbi:16S rRNA (cytosine(1402)-N(4))-methyltransferase RsmH [Chloroflexota bacterium]
MAPQSHVPVLVRETIDALSVQPGGRYIDCTVGAGGHAAAILDHSLPGGQLLGIDADPEALEIARSRLEAYQESTLIINENFANLQAICFKYDFFPVHGILFDLGLSSLQLSNGTRGFSFQYDSPLDMRFNPDQEVTAADIVNTYTETELAHFIRTYGEEGFSHQIARRIKQERPIRSTLHLARLIENVVGNRRGRIHPATKTFQALRIAVNRELEYLEAGLKQAIDLLGFEGRLVVISYHSLEDRIVKRFMQQQSRGDEACLRLIHKKVITPSFAEVQMNPRSRSAKLRVAERIFDQDKCYSTAEELCLSTCGGWRRPALLEKLRRTYLAL